MNRLDVLALAANVYQIVGFCLAATALNKADLIEELQKQNNFMVTELMLKDNYQVTKEIDDMAKEIDVKLNKILVQQEEILKRLDNMK